MKKCVELSCRVIANLVGVKAAVLRCLGPDIFEAPVKSYLRKSLSVGCAVLSLEIVDLRCRPNQKRKPDGSRPLGVLCLDLLSLSLGFKFVARVIFIAARSAGRP